MLQQLKDYCLKVSSFHADTPSPHPIGMLSFHVSLKGKLFKCNYFFLIDEIGSIMKPRIVSVFLGLQLTLGLQERKPYLLQSIRKLQMETRFQGEIKVGFEKHEDSTTIRLRCIFPIASELIP